MFSCATATWPWAGTGSQMRTAARWRTDAYPPSRVARSLRGGWRAGTRQCPRERCSGEFAFTWMETAVRMLCWLAWRIAGHSLFIDSSPPAIVLFVTAARTRTSRALWKVSSNFWPSSLSSSPSPSSSPSSPPPPPPPSSSSPSPLVV